MAQRRTVEVICDRCDSTEEVERWTLRNPDTRRQVTRDICGQCRRTVPLEEWLSQIPRNPRATRGGVVVSEAVVEKAARGRRR